MESINLTANAISMICTSIDPKPADDLKPIVQITDLRLVNTQKASSTERYRLMLSDGVYSQQGMLATQLNDLVKCGMLQKGSIVQLTEFTCGNVQNRMIIIIVKLDLILEQGDIIGEPRQFSPNAPEAQAPQQARYPPQVHSPVNQSVPTIDNPQSYGGSSFAGSAPRQTVSGGGGHMGPPEIDHGVGSNSYINSVRNPDMGRSNSPHPPSIYPKIESKPVVSGTYGGNSSRPFQQPYHQQSSVYNRGPVAKNEGAPRIFPIAALNPYQGSWTIKARVTTKAELRHYSNSKGEGKVFSFDLLDSAGGEIRVTCFNAVVDQFYDMIEVGKVYLISRGNLKPAQKNFNHLRNDFEITLDNLSIIQPCFDDDAAIPKHQFHFRPISDIEAMDAKTVVDVIGIVCSIGPSSSIMTKRGTETQKRVLHIKDMSGRSVEVTLWGNFCSGEGQRLQALCDSGVYPVLAVKSCIINEFNGKTLGTIGSSQLFIQPDFPEAQRMKGWFENEGKNTPSVPISREMSMVRTDTRKTISQIKDENLGTSEKADYISVSATIVYIKPENFYYTACPNVTGDRQCNKKVINNGDGTWRCDKCDQTMAECDYKYILQFQIQDHTNSTWVTAFQESGEEIMGVSAKELYDMKYESQEDAKFVEIFREALFSKYIFKLRVKEETFNDEQRVKSNVLKAEKVNFASETRFLLDLVNKLKNGDPNLFAPKQERREPAPPVGNYMGSTVTGQQFGAPVYVGPRLATTGSSGVSITCNGCGGSGHSFSNCPTTAQGQFNEGNFNVRGNSGGGGGGGGGGGTRSSSECFKCHQFGHWANDCPGLGNTPPASSGCGGGGAAAAASGQCYKCQQFGHWARDCPGLGNVPQAYGSGNAAVERYASGPKQYAGGF